MGEGDFTCLRALPIGTTDPLYLKTLSEILNIAKAFRPEFLIISLGCDTYEGDPYMIFGVTKEAFSTMGFMIAALKIPTLFVMENGFNRKIGKDDLPELFARVLAGFSGHPYEKPHS